MERRYAFEPVKAALDEYASREETTFLYRRAYRRFKFALHGLAYSDFRRDDSRPDDTTISYAWEDAEIAFKGHGEPSLTGCVVQLWAHVPKGKRNDYERMLVAAFDRAEELTPEGATRRYISLYRRKPIRRPEQGFNLPSILPINGPYLRDWAIDNDQDPAELEEKMYWLERADREVHALERMKEPERVGPGPFLQLVPDPTEEEE